MAPWWEKMGPFPITRPSGQIWIEAVDITGFAPILAGPFDGSMTNRIDAGDLPLSPGFDVSVWVSDAIAGRASSGCRLAGAIHQPRRWCSNPPTRAVKGHPMMPGPRRPHSGDQRLQVTVNAPGYEIAEQDFEGSSREQSARK